MKLTLILLISIVWCIFVIIYLKKKKFNRKLQTKKENAVLTNIETETTPTTQKNIHLENVSEQLKESFIKATNNGVGFKEWIKKEKFLLENLNFLREIEFTQKNGIKRKKLIYEEILEDVFRINTRLFYANNKYTGCMFSLMDFFRYYAENCPISSHKNLNNLVLPKSHIFWDTHFPPNALKCECDIRCYTQKMLEKRDLQITKDIPIIQLESLYNKNYAKYSELTNELITPYIERLDTRKKSKEIYTNIEYINIALEYIDKANKLKTTISKIKYLDLALIKLNDGLKDVNTDNELLNIEISKINKFKECLNTL